MGIFCNVREWAMGGRLACPTVFRAKVTLTKEGSVLCHYGSAGGGLMFDRVLDRSGH
jgi:hypothetical protein